MGGFIISFLQEEININKKKKFVRKKKGVCEKSEEGEHRLYNL